MMRWGMPPPPKFGGPPVTNISNTSSPHWRGWLKPENRCLVPANSFAEYAPEPKPNDEARAARFAAGAQDRRPGAFRTCGRRDDRWRAARTVINEDVVRTDDGIATGASARVALHAVRAERSGIGSYCEQSRRYSAPIITHAVRSNARRSAHSRNR